MVDIVRGKKTRNKTSGSVNNIKKCRVSMEIDDNIHQKDESKNFQGFSEIVGFHCPGKVKTARISQNRAHHDIRYGKVNINFFK